MDEDFRQRLKNRPESFLQEWQQSVESFNQYCKGEYIQYHGDFDAISHGAITTVGLFLNEDFEGGEFWYIEDEKEYKIEQKIGSVVVFKVGLNRKGTNSC